jgi:hypothetical protein
VPRLAFLLFTLRLALRTLPRALRLTLKRIISFFNCTKDTIFTSNPGLLYFFTKARNLAKETPFRATEAPCHVFAPFRLKTNAYAIFFPRNRKK